MGASGYGFRVHARSRWRGWIGRGLLFGLIGGTVLAAAAGARRTDTSYERFLEAQRAYDVLIPNMTDQGLAVFAPEDVVSLPHVADAVVGVYTYVTIGSGEAAIGDDDGRIGRDINRLKILEGRALDPDRPEEIVVSFAVADYQDIEVGDEVGFFNPAPEEEGELSPAQQRALARQRRVLPDGTLRVVGIEASPGEFPPHFPGSGWVHLSPALIRSGAIPSAYDTIMVRLEHGAEDVPAFLDELERLGDGGAVSVIDQREESREPNRSIHLQATAFWLVAGVLAAAAVVLVAQVESRATRLEADDSPIRGALGASRGQRGLESVLGRLPVAAVAAVTAVGVAVVLSPLAPVGIARIAEPDPGFHVDAAAMSWGPSSSSHWSLSLPCRRRGRPRASPLRVWVARRTSRSGGRRGWSGQRRRCRHQPRRPASGSP